MSRSLPVVVLENPAEPLFAADFAWLDRCGAGGRLPAQGSGEGERHVRPLPVVVVDVLGQQMVHVPGSEDDEVLDALYKGTGGGTRDFYDVDIAYDPASNILGVTDNVHKSSAGNRNFDALYTLDALNRLTRADEGTLTWSGGTGTISNRSRDERWQDASGNLALSQTGNWLRRWLDLNGDGAFTGTGELDDTGAFSLANELKTRDTDSNGTPNYTLAYDKSGNQTDDGKDYTYVYDGFGRLRQVKNRSDSSLVAEYRYNGLSFRIGWHYDADADKDVDSADPWYYFCYDDAWRVVATFRAGDADPKEVFVHHNAGLGGYGGSSYIDSASCAIIPCVHFGQHFRGEPCHAAFR